MPGAGFVDEGGVSYRLPRVEKIHEGGRRVGLDDGGETGSGYITEMRLRPVDHQRRRDELTWDAAGHHGVVPTL